MIDTNEMVRCDGVSRSALEARLREAAKELDARLVFIGELQARGTALIDEARANRRIANAPPGELVALSHVSHERRLQDDRWGPIEDHLDVPIGSTTGYGFSLRSQREAAASHCASTGRDTCCWAHVILEEAYELLAEPESEPKRIRAEAVQLAACCVKLIEILDRRANSNPLPVTGGIPLPGWTCTATRLVTDGETTRQACCQTFNGANPKWLAQCRACGSHGPAEAK